MTQASPSPATTPFDLIGGEAGVARLANAFYDVMASDPAAQGLRGMHAADLAPMRERLADWLTGWMGGPRVYNQRHPGRGCIMSAHRPYEIGEGEAAQWMACMRQAFERAQVSGELRAMIEPAMAGMAQALRNR